MEENGSLDYLPLDSVTSLLYPPTSNPDQYIKLESYDVIINNISISAPSHTSPLPVLAKLHPIFQNRKAVEIVKNVSIGKIHSGELVALVGGSGSGKTSLLNAIGKKDSGLLQTGSIQFQSANGSIYESTDKLGFVSQSDNLLEYLTPYETLAFAAELRLPKSIPAETKKKIVEDTIRELGLLECQHTLIGGAFKKGLSGGEKRRVSIGQILVTMPSVLVMDEPNTGLDSFSSNQLLQLLKGLAKRGRTIIISIHQPRADALVIFDQVILLSGGELVYGGKTDYMLEWFRDLGFQHNEASNGLDFVIDLAAIDDRTRQLEVTSRERVSKLITAWKNRIQEGKRLNYQKQDLESEETNGAHAAISRMNEDILPGFFTQTLILSQRSIKNVSRNLPLTIGLLCQAITVSFVIGGAFYQSPETPAGINSIKAGIYQLISALYYQSNIVACYIWTQELRVFDREFEYGLYSAGPWVIASLVSLLPAITLFPALYGAIVYAMMGLRKDNLVTNLFSFMIQNSLQQLCSFGYALLASSIDRSFPGATLIANAMSMIFILGSGYIITDLGIWIRWTRYISPYFAQFSWSATQQFKSRVFSCTGVTGIASNQCNGNQVLVGLGLPTSAPIYAYPLGMLAFCLVVYSLSTLILTYYHPGGVKHAISVISTHLETKSEDLEIEKVAFINEEKNQNVTIRVNNLSLSVSDHSLLKNNSSGGKEILSNVTATFPRGVTAIMGPSGAGKSSLMQLFASRLSTANLTVTGSITINDVELNSSHAARIGYVAQDDSYHLPHLTVRETLHYSATLRLPGIAKTKVVARAETVMKKLGLSSCADVLVGGELIKGISGGEKRRLSLAIELLSDPVVLIADEPLSGLDSFSEFNRSASCLASFNSMCNDQMYKEWTAPVNVEEFKKSRGLVNSSLGDVMKTMREIWDDLNRGDKEDVLSIVRKRASDNLAVATRIDDAKTIEISVVAAALWSGRNVPLDLRKIRSISKEISADRTIIISAHQPREMIFELFDNVLLMASKGRIAYTGNRERIIEHLESTGYILPPGTNPADFILEIISIDSRSDEALSASTHRLQKVLSAWKWDSSISKEEPESFIKFSKFTPKSKSFVNAFPVLLSRSITNLNRGRDAQLARFTNPPAVCFIFIVFFGHLTLEPGSVQTRIGLIQQTMCLPFIGMLGALSVFPAERDVYLREYRTSARHSPLTFLAAYSTQEVLLSIISSLGFTFMMTFAIGLRSSASQFLPFWFCSFALLSIGESIAIIFCSFVDDGGLAVSLVSTAITAIIQLNGSAGTTIPKWLQYLGWATPSKLQTTVIMIGEFKGLVFNCDEASKLSGACIAATGSQLLNTFEIDENQSISRLLLGLTGLVIIYRLIGLMALKIRISKF